MATKSPANPTKHPPASSTLPKQDDGGTTVLERVPQKTKPPLMYQVVMLNDDYTPMEFVVFVIQEFFKKDRQTATQIMLKIHLDGKAVCGIFSKDIATSKVEQVSQAAKEHGHPLQCLAEPME